MSDISETLKVDSTQINADDLIGSSVTITVTQVKVKQGEQQPVDIFTRETPGKAYRPSKTMRKLLAEAWGTDSSVWVGRALTLYRNPDITFGKERVGGIEISHMSHLEQPITIALTVGRGRKRSFHVKPLQAPQQVAEQSLRVTDWSAAIQEANGDQDALRQLWAVAQGQQEPQEVFDQITTAAQGDQE